MCFTDHGFLSALLLLDLSAAFDTVDHEVLMNILKDRFSIGHHELDWFRSYHSERQHTFKTTVDSSGPEQLTCSVRQGSVLGPKEFIEYTEEIVETINKFDINHRRRRRLTATGPHAARSGYGAL